MSKSMRQDGASKRDQHSRARTDQELDGVNGGFLIPPIRQPPRVVFATRPLAMRSRNAP